MSASLAELFGRSCIEGLDLECLDPAPNFSNLVLLLRELTTLPGAPVEQLEAIAYRLDALDGVVIELEAPDMPELSADDIKLEPVREAIEAETDPAWELVQGMLDEIGYYLDDAARPKWRIWLAWLQAKITKPAAVQPVDNGQTTCEGHADLCMAEMPELDEPHDDKPVLLPGWRWVCRRYESWVERVDGLCRVVAVDADGLGGFHIYLRAAKTDAFARSGSKVEGSLATACGVASRRLLNARSKR